MPRAQVSLSGVAWFTTFALLWVKVAIASVVHVDDLLSAGKDDELFDAWRQSRVQDASLAKEWSGFFARQMDTFQVNLLQNMGGSHTRHKREMRQRASVSEIRVLDDAFSKFGQQNSPALSCFLWEEEKYCVYGDSVIAFSQGKALHLLSNLPIQEGDQIRTHVYDGLIFIAFFNRLRSTLRLHILRSPSSTTIAEVQHIFGEKLEDCQFFEHGGVLHMALAIHLGPTQFAKDLGMRCVIYKWIGTTMDMIHSLPAPSLYRIAVFHDSTYTHLVLVQRNSYVQLWRMVREVQTAELLEKINIGLSDVVQVKAFPSQGHWCTLFAAQARTLIYCVMGQRLLRWQVIEHDEENAVVAWAAVPVDATSTILALFLKEEVRSFSTNTSGLFEPGLISSSQPLDPMCDFLAVESLAEVAGTARNVLVSCSNSGALAVEVNLVIEDFNWAPSDPLVDCLNDLTTLLGEQAAVLEQAELLKGNMVRVDDDFETSGTVALNGVHFRNGRIREVQVLSVLSNEFNTSAEIDGALNVLLNGAGTLANDLPNLFYPANQTVDFKGRLTFGGIVASPSVTFTSASLITLNGRIWDQLTESVWSYSRDQIIDHDLRIDSIAAGEVRVGGTLGGALPSEWLLSSGDQVLSGSVSFQQVEVAGEVNLAPGKRVNEVHLEDVLVPDAGQLVVGGVKKFADVNVKGDVKMNGLINEHDLGEWFGGLLSQTALEEQHLTGVVTLTGSIMADDNVGCTLVNRVNMADFKDSVVLKSVEQTITGNIEFVGNAAIESLSTASLNSVSLGDLLTKSTDQTIQSSLSFSSLQVNGNIQATSVNGIKVEDIVFFDDAEPTVDGSVVFQKGVTVKDVVTLADGSLNGITLQNLMNPDSLTIASDVVIDGDLSADNLEASMVNDIDIVDLKNRFWTKSTDQTIPVALKMNSKMIVQRNVSSLTLNGRPMDQFFALDSPQIVSVPVEFNDEVIFAGALSLGSTIDDVNVDELMNKTVQTVGEFDVKDTKTFKRLKVNGHLYVEQTFNDVEIPDGIALLNREQTFTNVDFVSGVSVSGDVTVKGGDVTLAGYINDIKPSEFASAVVRTDEDAVIDGELEFEGGVVVGDLHVGGRVNDVDLQNLLDFGLRRFGRDSQNISDLTIRGALRLKDSLQVALLNGYDLDKYLAKVVNRRDPGLVTGVKRAAAVAVRQDLTLGTLNDAVLDFTQLLSVTKDQRVSGKYSVGNVDAGEVQVSKVNGFDLVGFLLLDADSVQNVTGDITFEHLILQGHLDVVTENVNDCKIAAAEPLTMSVEDIPSFHSLTIVDGQLILEQPSDNNELLADLLKHAVRLDRSNIVTADVVIDGAAEPCHFANVNIASGMLGQVNLGKLFDESMRKSTDQVVASSLNFTTEDGITFETIEHITNLDVKVWNGIDVGQLLENMVYKTGDHVITAKKDVDRIWNITGDLTLLGTINGVHVNDLVKTTDLELPWNTTFTSLEILDNITAGRLIDGVDLGDFLSLTVPKDGDAVISGDVLFQRDITIGDLSVRVINDIAITDLVLRTAAPRQEIFGLKTFIKDIELEGDVFVQTLNDVNLGEFFDDVVLQDQDAEFNEEAIFASDLHIVDNTDIAFYNGDNLTEAILSKFAGHEEAALLVSSLQTNAKAAMSLLEALHSARTSLKFEYFDFQGSMGFNDSGLVDISMGHPSSSWNGVLSVTKALNGTQCNMEPLCTCYRSQIVDLTSRGQREDFATYRNVLENLGLENGTHYVLPETKSNSTFVVTFHRPCSMEENVEASVIRLDGELAIKNVQNVPVPGGVDDVVLKASSDGKVVLVIARPEGVEVLVLGPDAEDFVAAQTLPVTNARALDFAAHGEKLFLAVAAPELSSLWSFNGDGGFELIREVNAEGAADVVFSATPDEIYVTFTQTGDRDIWTDYSLPPEVYLYDPRKDSFYIYGQLTIDRSTALSTFSPDGVSQFLVAANPSTVAVYELIRGQGFVSLQSFTLPDIVDVESFSFNGNIFLAVAYRAPKIQINGYIARFRGFRKPV